MALTNGLVAPWHVQRGTFILSLSPFPFYFFPPFLPLSFFFPSSSLSSSFSQWFVQWILFPFLFFSSSFFITRCAISSFDSCDGKLSLCRERERVARLVTFEGLFFPCYSAFWRIVSSRNGRFSQRGGGERERVGGINGGIREFRFRGKPKTGELRVVYDSSDGKTSEVLMLEVICFESCYTLFRPGMGNFGRVSINFFFFSNVKSNCNSLKHYISFIYF